MIANAKAFARALSDCGLDVAGDPDIDFTETHQVVVHVGYAHGPEIARRLEATTSFVTTRPAPMKRASLPLGRYGWEYRR